jgi:serine/threonine protein kinase
MTPRRIGKYEVRSLLGEGAMGTVYLCEHAVLGRKAAVKVLKPAFTHDRGLIARFVNEARAATAIGHPGIVDVLDVEVPDEDGGPPYMVMEYLRGETLSARIKRSGRIGVKDAVALTLQVASALGAAHEKGIVHRDLKPENLFLVPDPLGPVPEKVKVLDFGVAKLRALSGRDTAVGTRIGTPFYMSPEQWRGVSDDVDHRADIYALGIVLYEMLCGQPPFVGTIDEVVVMHREQPPPPPSTRNRAIPPRIERTILCALAKSPADRFASMRELRQALGDPDVLARPAIRTPAGAAAEAVPATLHLTDTALAEVPGQAPPFEEQPGQTRLLPPEGEAARAEPAAKGSIEMTPQSLPPRSPGGRGLSLVIVSGALGGLALAGVLLLRTHPGPAVGEPAAGGAMIAQPPPVVVPAPPPAPTVTASPPTSHDEPARTEEVAPAAVDGDRKAKRPTKPARGKPASRPARRTGDDKDPLNVPKW